jgi:lysophospholipase L1-like esterase
MRSNQFISVLLTLILTALLLLAYPFLHHQVPFLQNHFKTYQGLPFLAAEIEQNAGTRADSIMLSDSLVLASSDSLEPFYQVSELVGLKDYSGTFALIPFFESLKGKDPQIRVAYYGDSSIEGDLISQTVRDSLQRHFGGAGIGFMPIKARTKGFRRSIRHSYSDNWYHNYLGRKNTRQKRRGISGDYFLTYSEIQIDTIKGDSLRPDSIVVIPPDQSYWVSYRPVKRYREKAQIPSARLFYGTPDYSDSLTVKGPVGQVRLNTGAQSDTFFLEYKQLVNEIALSDTTTDLIRLNFDTPPDLPVYGVSMESKTGVILDNFSSRGNLGPGLNNITLPVLREFQSLLDYNLIILQFGLNVTHPELTDLSWYERDMVKVIDHYKTAFPNTSLLIIGPPDKATKLGGQMRTDPSVPRINAALQRVAMRTGVGFFSLYEAMGGEGSMVDWVEKKRPRLANFDYTHFNFKGAAIAGNFVMDYLMTAFEAYEVGDLKAVESVQTKGEGPSVSKPLEGGEGVSMN